MKHKPVKLHKLGHAVAVLAGGLLAGAAAHAMDLNPDGDWQVRWDNTLKYSGGYRLKNPDSGLVSPAASKRNNDDGDRNIQKGLMSNRMDWLTEFDVQKDGFGFRMSAAAWYDTVYNRSNDNNSASTANITSGAYNQFTNGTQTAAGKNIELLDLFAFGKVDIGDTRLSLRAGQFSQIWGTSLFFGNNGIAKGMAPIDIYKLNIPGTTAKETTLPVPQISGTWQLTDSTSVEAYVQAKFKPTRLPPAGSYFSSADFLGPGREVFDLGTMKLNYAGEIKGSHSPNFGVALNTHSDLLDTDFGFYALRYQDTSPQVFTQVPNKRYWIAYPQNIRVLGSSFGTQVGDANVSGEMSVRFGQPLAAKQGSLSIAAGQTNTNLGSSAAYPTGKTLHANLSTVNVLGPSALWGGASLTGELAANHVMSIDRNESIIDTTRNKTSVGARVIFTPTYYQVLPGLDLSPSINLGWSFKGNSMIDTAFPFAGSPNKGGDLVLGISGVYLSKWTANLSYVRYLGKIDTQAMLDRDYIRFSLQTSF
ncbi:DUF1302 domain-containing protein [Diaphorobacter sp. HDW4A]|uniref:DUF1302 domain-containing protein n=1 Tax=Diaphorobacter sp. HDW4A TaxID=2714924 RepID=UPI00140D334F|nr:DUF1302 family protein [Diaphorobacter sp. HDW4A]QIL79275.1 DUF1302 domain-containing protein [Diaphorobacter sp. HDW4A]